MAHIAPITIDVWSLEEAWKQACRAVMESGYDYKIDRGSYIGQMRRQLTNLALVIQHPEARPLAPLCKPGELPVTDSKTIEKYFANYLLNSELARNEQYTYGSRMSPHLEVVAEILSSNPGTNQAVLEIARPWDIRLQDPPCLRSLAWNVYNNILHLTTFWRSWDIYTALPTNLGGLQLLNEMMAEWSGLIPGPMVAYSSGAHIYEHAWRLV